MVENIQITSSIDLADFASQIQSSIRKEEDLINFVLELDNRACSESFTVDLINSLIDSLKSDISQEEIKKKIKL